MLQTTTTERVIPAVYASNDYPFTRGYKTTRIIPTKYGYRIHRFSNYISLQYIKVEYLDNGFSKATVKVNTNYQTPYQYTIYFDNKGNEIKAESHNTKLERKIWLKMQSAN